MSESSAVNNTADHQIDIPGFNPQTAQLLLQHTERPLSNVPASSPFWSEALNHAYNTSDNTADVGTYSFERNILKNAFPNLKTKTEFMSKVQYYKFHPEALAIPDDGNHELGKSPYDRLLNLFTTRYPSERDAPVLVQLKDIFDL